MANVDSKKIDPNLKQTAMMTGNMLICAARNEVCWGQRKFQLIFFKLKKPQIMITWGGGYFVVSI